MNISTELHSNNNFRNTKESFLPAARPLILALLSVLITGCVSWPDIESDCESYGVVESNQAMGKIVHMEPLYHDQLAEVCTQVAIASGALTENLEIRGCVIPQGKQTVYGYYSVGDRCAMYHEMCHAKHGGEHTRQYEQDLAGGIPMPYCPRNQLKLFTSN